MQIILAHWRAIVTDEERFLDILGIRKGAPSLALLVDIVKRHLASVPYENVSKLIHFHEIGPTIPSFAEFVTGLVDKTYGGTCFAQSIHLNHLLKELGFKSKLMGIRREGLLSHIGISVSIDGFNYLVDVGIMSSVAFRPHLSQSRKTNWPLVSKRLSSHRRCS